VVIKKAKDAKVAKMAKIIYRTSLIRMFPTKPEKWG
jgi:hypothetical protein